jgi:lysophospholipase L1-like esterase
LTWLLLALAPCAAYGARCDHRHWVGAWSGSPSDTAQEPLKNQTIRMVVAPHVGGHMVRVRLTNRFGVDPITLTNVRIGKRSSDASIVPGTNRRVSWDGRGRVTIQPGHEAASDPVRMRSSAFRSLAVSAYVNGVVNAPTRHLIAKQTSYVTPQGAGDHSSDEGGGAFTSSVTSWLLVDGVDISTKRRMGAVVAFGDSNTDGLGSPMDADSRYPDYLARRLLRQDGGPRLSVLNAGISGNALLVGFIPQYGPSGLSRARADVIDQPAATDVLMLEGRNDLDFASARDVISGLRTLVRRFRSHGLHVLLGTITPGATGEQAERRRRRVNRWIRGRRRSRVVDFDRAVRSRTNPGRLASRYDSGDHLHLNAAGYRAMAAAIHLSQLHGGTCR